MNQITNENMKARVERVNKHAATAAMRAKAAMGGPDERAALNSAEHWAKLATEAKADLDRLVAAGANAVDAKRAYDSATTEARVIDHRYQAGTLDPKEAIKDHAAYVVANAKLRYAASANEAAQAELEIAALRCASHAYSVEVSSAARKALHVIETIRRNGPTDRIVQKMCEEQGRGVSRQEQPFWNAAEEDALAELGKAGLAWSLGKGDGNSGVVTAEELRAFFRLRRDAYEDVQQSNNAFAMRARGTRSITGTRWTPPTPPTPEAA